MGRSLSYKNILRSNNRFQNHLSIDELVILGKIRIFSNHVCLGFFVHWIAISEIVTYFKLDFDTPSHFTGLINHKIASLFHGM